MNASDWRARAPYANQRSGFAVTYQARCFCGAVSYEVCAAPVASKLCHCARCRGLHGAPFQWAVIFHKQDVRFTRGVDHLYCFHAGSGEPVHRLPCTLSCARCHAPVADEGRNMFLAFGPLFDFGTPALVPHAYRPTCHIFYAARVLDVNDDLPKYPGPQPPRTRP